MDLNDMLNLQAGGERLQHQKQPPRCHNTAAARSADRVPPARADRRARYPRPQRVRRHTAHRGRGPSRTGSTAPLLQAPERTRTRPARTGDGLVKAAWNPLPGARSANGVKTYSESQVYGNVHGCRCVVGLCCQHRMLPCSGSVALCITSRSRLP